MRPRHNKECELSALPAAWLRSRGYTVYAEVPICGHSRADLVGYKTDYDLVVVELKLAWTKDLYAQCRSRQMAVPNVYACSGDVPTNRMIDFFVAHGVGMLRLAESTCHVLAEPNHLIPVTPKYRDDLLAILKHMQPSDVGGKRYHKAAQDCHENVAQYIASHPHAQWTEIWRTVPNHYSSARSMKSAMNIVARKKEKTDDDPTETLVLKISRNTKKALERAFNGQTFPRSLNVNTRCLLEASIALQGPPDIALLLHHYTRRRNALIPSARRNLNDFTNNMSAIRSRGITDDT